MGAQAVYKEAEGIVVLCAKNIQSEGPILIQPMRAPAEAGGACITQKSTTILRLYRSKGPLVLPRLFQMDSTLHCQLAMIPDSCV